MSASPPCAAALRAIARDTESARLAIQLACADDPLGRMVVPWNAAALTDQLSTRLEAATGIAFLPDVVQEAAWHFFRTRQKTLKRKR